MKVGLASDIAETAFHLIFIFFISI